MNYRVSQKATRCITATFQFAALGLAISVRGDEGLSSPEVDFSSQIRPLLSDRCYKCHGPDDNARVTNFRLDLEDVAFADLDDAGNAIVKGDLDQSVAWQRIHSVDPDLQMPPPDSNLSLSEQEKALITEWIRQGAKWQEHWAFIPPRKAAVPASVDTAGKKANVAQNPIDRFVATRSKERGLTSSPEAKKERLIRRVTFDLTGLPRASKTSTRSLLTNHPTPTSG